MCGIAGLWNWELSRGQGEQVAKGMLDRLAHRGPCESGHFQEEDTLLAATRLAIFDCKNGSQPFLGPQGRYALVYNGAVYNYLELREELQRKGFSFVTDSDTEVVWASLVLWGSSALSKFNGMFALAFYDRAKKSLLLARDRFGQKPLYYRIKDGGVAFASEMKAFLEVPGLELELDPESLGTLFQAWVPLPDRTAFRKVRQLYPGTALEFVASPEPREIVFAAWPKGEESGEKLQASVVKQMLTESVALRLRGDVQVGLYLSGGLDSSVLAALAVRRLGADLRTFSVSFEDSTFDESAEQNQVSEYLGTRHRTLQVTSQDIVEAFPLSIYHAETPVFRTALTPMFLLSKLVRKEGLKVVLSGEGADEVLLGYNLFRETLLRAEWPHLNEREQQSRLAQLYPYQAHFGEGHTQAMASLFARLSGETGEPLFSHRLRFHNSAFALKFFKGPGSSDVLEPWRERLRKELGTDSDVIERAQWLEFRTLLGGYLLSSQGDRAAMAHSVEARAPFLDPNFVNLLMSHREEILKGASLEKDILRRAMKNELPAACLSQRKTPYRSPGASTFWEHQPDYLDCIASSEELANQDVFEPKLVQRLVKKLRQRCAEKAAISPRDDHTFLLILSTLLLRHSFKTLRSGGRPQ